MDPSTVSKMRRFASGATTSSSPSMPKTTTKPTYVKRSGSAAVCPVPEPVPEPVPVPVPVPEPVPALAPFNANNRLTVENMPSDPIKTHASMDVPSSKYTVTAERDFCKVHSSASGFEETSAPRSSRSAKLRTRAPQRTVSGGTASSIRRRKI